MLARCSEVEWCFCVVEALPLDEATLSLCRARARKLSAADARSLLQRLVLDELVGEPARASLRCSGGRKTPRWPMRVSTLRCSGRGREVRWLRRGSVDAQRDLDVAVDEMS
jgi:hypothetical protein